MGGKASRRRRNTERRSNLIIKICSVTLLNLHPTVKGIILFVIILIAFLLIRGCQYAKNKAAENVALHEALDSLVIQQEGERAVSQENRKNYDASLEYANGIIELRNNQVATRESELHAANDRITALLNRHIQLSPSTDTSVTVAPNEYIQDCESCFQELATKQQLIKLYVEENKELDSAHLSKETIQDARISQISDENKRLSATLNDCLSLAKSQLKTLQPRRKVLFSMASIWTPIPKAVGAGFLYQDKRGRQFGLKGYVSEWGTLGETEINLPLSFKRH